VLELTYTSRTVQPFARDLGDTGQPFRWQPERRAVIQAEIDAAMAHLYGVSRVELDHILDSFPGLRRNEEHPVNGVGEYRTKRLVLENYDALGRAASSGVPFASSLTPAPGEGPRHS
jgi:hypothetical protein